MPVAMLMYDLTLKAGSLQTGGREVGQFESIQFSLMILLGENSHNVQ